MPGALLIEKCKANLRSGTHPVIITIFDRVHTALNLAEDAGLAGRVEVWDVQQFLSANVYEHSLFDETKRNSTLLDIISRYNDIVLNTETDPSLRIEFEARWKKPFAQKQSKIMCLAELRTSQKSLGESEHCGNESAAMLVSVIKINSGYRLIDLK